MGICLAHLSILIDCRIIVSSLYILAATAPFIYLSGSVAYWSGASSPVL